MVEEEQELSNVEWGENRFPSSFPFHRRLDNIKQHNTTSEWKYIPKYIWYAYINTLYTAIVQVREHCSCTNSNNH